MKRLFISQPMKGKTDKEILAVREKAIRSAEEKLGEPVEVIDSFIAHQQTQDRCGSWARALNCFLRLMWLSLPKAGRMQGGVRLRIPVPLSTVLM